MDMGQAKPGKSNKYGLGTRIFGQRLKALFRQPVFLILTIWGHACILGGTLAFYSVERLVNPKVHSLLDALVWTIATITTVGHAEIVPVTLAGKWISIAIMILGSLFLWSYTALFASALVAPELSLMEREIGELEREMQRDLKKELEFEQRSTRQLLSEIESLTQELKKRSQP